MAKKRKQTGTQAAQAEALKALGHPLRLAVLAQLNQRNAAASPSLMAEALEVPLPNLSYHVRMLLTYGLLKLRRTQPRRGAIEHFYEITPLGRQVLALAEELRMDTTGAQAA